MNALDKFLKGHGIQHFTSSELYTRTRPPRHLWPNILPTLLVAERLRARLQPHCIMRVTSGYRDEAHNREVGGAPAQPGVLNSGSRHLHFNALDLVPLSQKRGTPTAPIPLVAVAFALEEDPLLDFLGIGIYQSFLHLDTRGLFSPATPGVRF